MRQVFGRPVLLVPLGIVLLVAGLVVAFGGLGAYQTGTAVEEQRLCETAAADGEACFEKVAARLDGPRLNRRAAGRTYVARPIDESQRLGGFAVTRDDAERIEALDPGTTVQVWVTPEDPHDVVAVEIGPGEVVATNLIGLRGLAAHLSFGLLVLGLAAACLLAGVRFARAGAGWLRADTTTPLGPGALVLLTVPAFAGVAATRLGAAPVVQLSVGAVTVLCIAAGLVLWSRSRDAGSAAGPSL